MVHLYFRVLAPVAGIPGTTAGQDLCVHLGAEGNVVIRQALHVPEGVLYGLIGHALLDGSLEDITPGPKPAAVSEALRLAVGGGLSPRPLAPSVPDAAPPPLELRRWRRARSRLRPVP